MWHFCNKAVRHSEGGQGGGIGRRLMTIKFSLSRSIYIYIYISLYISIYIFFLYTCKYVNIYVYIYIRYQVCGIAIMAFRLPGVVEVRELVIR